MLKHASPKYSAVYTETLPFSPVLSHISSDERLNLEEHQSSTAFTKAPGFFMRSGKASRRPRIGIQMNRRNMDKKRNVDKGSPRPSFEILESRLKEVKAHWKRKAWTKARESLDFSDGESPRKKKALSPIESHELEEVDTEPLSSSDFFDHGGDYLPDQENESHSPRSHIALLKSPFKESLENSLSDLPTGLHVVDVQIRHRTRSGRDAEILMAGKDDQGTTVLVKYGDSEALQLRSLKSVVLKASSL